MRAEVADDRFGYNATLEDAQIELRDREAKRGLDARVSVRGQRREL